MLTSLVAARIAFLSSFVFLIIVTWEAFQFPKNIDLAADQLVVNWMESSDQISKTMLLWMSSCFWLALLHMIRKRDGIKIFLIGFLLCLSVVFFAVLAIFQAQIIAGFAGTKHEKVIMDSGFLLCIKIGVGEIFTKKRQPNSLKDVDATVYQKNCNNVTLDFSLDEPKRTIVLERTEALIRRANIKEGRPAYKLCSSEQSTWQKDLYRPPSENNTYLSKATFSLDCSLK